MAVRRKPLAFDPVAQARRHWERRGWRRAAAGMAAVTSLMRAQQIVLARVEDVLRPHGLTFARYEVLMLLTFSRNGSLPLSRLGERLQVHPASVTNVVDRLQSQALIRRVPHPTDRRTTLAEVTDRGRSIALAASEDLNATVFADPGLSADGVRQLVEVLTDLRRTAGDFA
jgi:DNA-binding MarR family transcriptional regulator